MSAYTLCRSNKGPQNEWLHRIGKKDTDKCRCGEAMTGTHVVEECPELNQWRPRRAEWAEWREALGRRAREKEKEKDAAEEEEVDLLEVLFYHIYEFLSPVTTRATIAKVQADDPVVPVNFVPVSPIAFVRAVSASSVSS